MKKIVTWVLIILTVLYVIACTIYISNMVSGLKENESVDWISVVLYSISIPVGIWFIRFILPWVLSVFKKRSFKHIFIISLIITVLGIVVQLGASFILARIGFGYGDSYQCSKCAAWYRDVDGRYLSGHYFYIKMRYTNNKGDINCNHEWKYEGYGHAYGCVPYVYRGLLTLSHCLFYSSAGLIIIFCGYWLIMLYARKRITDR